VALLASTGLPTQAASFQYAEQGDILVGFRHPEASFELLVSAGSVTNLAALSPGQSLPIEGVTSARLAETFASLEGVQWSAYGGWRTGGLPVASTLWVARPREAGLTTAGAPWPRKSASAHNIVRSALVSSGNTVKAWAAGTLAPPAGSIRNTNTAVVYPAEQSPGIGYSHFMGTVGNWNYTFWGFTEATLPTPFAEADLSVLDLFELSPLKNGEPEDAPGVWLGSLEFASSGSLRFVRAGGSTPGPIPPPVISRIVRADSTVRISFTTTNDATVRYTLRLTNLSAVLTSPAGWASGTGVVTGDGGVHTLEDTAGPTPRAYRLEAIR
jgi:hypothetical protein